MRFLLFFLLSSNIFAQNTAKPWAYWWWLGSAVDKNGISKNLESYQKTGFGGMHIIPIYGVKGEESKFIPYLSPEWFEMLDFTVQEANRLGLGIDMTLGTGWPFGGKHVGEADAAKALKINSEKGIYSAESIPTKQQVKRAAPNAEGFVIDHFSEKAIKNYLQPYQNAFSAKNYGVRAFYNDSYEAYGANWTDTFLADFKRLRHYDLQPYLNILEKLKTENQDEKRVWADYHATLSDLLHDNFTKNWVDFSHTFGKISRNEAHGSPANILDLYALADIPESEFFGSKPYRIPLYRQDPDYQESRFGKPDFLVLKLASSPAHILKKPLVASETATWLGNHFKVTLAQIKPIIDESFTAGINHIFYHGLPYSPPDEPFPGWLFYASTNFNQNSHFWEYLPLLNRYVENCQNLLQNSEADNDVLVYFPIQDLWHSAGTKHKTHAIDVHDIRNGGIFTPKFITTLEELKNNGFAFDFVSDKQLMDFAVNKGNLKNSSGSQYQTILVPEIDYLPLETLNHLLKIKENGGKIIFMNQLPKFVNGFLDYKIRQIEFEQKINQFKNNVAQNLTESLQKNGIRQEFFAQQGLSFIRKKKNNQHIYFISNLDSTFKKNKIHLAISALFVEIYNPLTEKKVVVKSKKNQSSIEIDLDLKAGESVFVTEMLGEMQKAQGIRKEEKSQSKELKTPHISHLTVRQSASHIWKVSFLKGEPFLPAPFTTDTLKSWTLLGDTTKTQYFSGKAEYLTNFSINARNLNKTAFLDLGDVRDIAEVWLNEKYLGVAWSLPFRLKIPKGILKTENELKIHVSNVSANRVRYLDQQKVPWKKFYDINFVDINYKAFDASNWKPVEAGLLGEVKVVMEED